jgi:hypothetical protein
MSLPTNLNIRPTGLLLAAGGILALAVNVVFPRVDDPWDTVAVLSMMAENETLRQISFLGVTVAVLTLAAGASGIHRLLREGPGETWGRIGLAGVLLGAVLLTASVGLGLAATPAAVSWVAAGSPAAGTEFAIAATLNAADDHVWFMSIVMFWGGLGFIGLGMSRTDHFPRWSGWVIAGVGLTTAVVVGVPLAYGVQSPTLLVVFGILATGSAIWAVATGWWMVRKVAAR